MPSWQIPGKVRDIVTPNDPPESGSLVRWNIIGKVVPGKP